MFTLLLIFKMLHSTINTRPRGNKNPYIEEERTTQWPKEKVQNKGNNKITELRTILQRESQTVLTQEISLLEYIFVITFPLILKASFIFSPLQNIL
jgi:hypothetical protein